MWNWIKDRGRNIVERVGKIIKRYINGLKENGEYYIAFIIIFIVLGGLVNKFVVVIFNMPNHKINIIDTIIAVLFIDFIMEVFKDKSNANKADRCDWDIYDATIQYFTIIELVLEEVGNAEWRVRNNRDDFKEDISKLLKSVRDWEEKVELKTKLGTRSILNKKELFVYGLSDLNKQIDTIMTRYYSTIDDTVFRDLH